MPSVARDAFPKGGTGPYRFCHEVYDANYKATIGVDFEVEKFSVLHVPFSLQM